MKFTELFKAKRIKLNCTLKNVKIACKWYFFVL